MDDLPEHVFYSTIQEHLYCEHTLVYLDHWLDLVSITVE